ncbi:MAG: hypothetical protein WD750_04440 [Gammaproteobacteria bacterium]
MKKRIIVKEPMILYDSVALESGEYIVTNAAGVSGFLEIDATHYILIDVKGDLLILTLILHLY